jgi:hypothetical protein
MPSIRFARLVRAAGAAVIATGLIASGALADAPTRVIDELDFTVHFDAGERCPFPVDRTITGTRITTTFVDQAGLEKIATSFKAGKIVYTNPANGRSIFTVLAGPAIETDNGDGTTTIFVPGDDQAYHAPGVGFVVGNTGLSIVTVDTATGALISIDKLAGHQDGVTFPAFCVGLE